MRAAGPVTCEHRMIPRYSRPEMAALFAPETRLGIWLDVELAAAVAANRERPLDPTRVEEIEAWAAAVRRLGGMNGLGRVGRCAGTLAKDPTRFLGPRGTVATISIEQAREWKTSRPYSRPLRICRH